jgi:hypothetical protein
MRMNGFGYALRETGQSRVPAPPERITGTSMIQNSSIGQEAATQLVVPALRQAHACPELAEGPE